MRIVEQDTIHFQILFWTYCILVHNCTRHQTKNKTKKTVWIIFKYSCDWIFLAQWNEPISLTCPKENKQHSSGSPKLAQTLKVTRQSKKQKYINNNLSHVGYLQTSKVKSQTCHISVMAQKSRLSSTAAEQHSFAFLFNYFFFNKSYILFLGNRTIKKWHNTTWQDFFFYPITLSNWFFLFTFTLCSLSSSLF